MRRRPFAAGRVALVGLVLALTACGTETPIAVERSRDLGELPQVTDPTGPTTDPTGPTTDPTGPSTDPTGPSTDPTTDPTGPTTDPSGPTTTRPPRDVIEEGDAKEDQPWDEVIEATIADLENMWSTTYPELYGEPYEPLSGGVWPGYPARTDPIPGCGKEETTYEEVAAYAAFYCGIEDFIVYDDGDDGLLAQLADDLDISIIPVVLAHEWGHAIQQRNGTFAQRPDTIYTEQQADCWSGAWTARARNGDVPGIEFTDEDVRAGLAALIVVRDPIDTDPNAPNAHGAGFDRVGAFQVGYLEGVARCVELIEKPLPLVPNVFAVTETDRVPNAPFEDRGTDDPGIFTILQSDLNRYWPQVFESTETPFPTLELAAASDPSDVGCADLESVDDFAGYCEADQTVYYDEEFARELYEQFGDFGIGYLLGAAWSDAAQDLLGSPFTGEERALLNDCLTGSWVSTILPDESGNPPANVNARVEPGDLDEAVQTVILIGDDNADVNEIGTAFEKIDSFRDGALNGLDACSDRIPD